MRNSLTVFMLCLLLQSLDAQEATVRPIPRERPIVSIFSNDTCAPPCWFGLIPGESTGQETLDFLLSYEHVSGVYIYENNETIYIEAGTEARENEQYGFNFGPSERMLCCGIYSHVLIREGLLDMFWIVVRENITLGEVIENMGWPDDIRLTAGYHPSDFYFTFIYYEPYVRLTIGNGESRRRETLCNYFSTQDNFFVGGAEYYSPQTALELVEIYVPAGEPAQYQPRLLAYNDEKYVPPDLWPIVTGDTAYLCEDLWERLGREDVLPEWAENQ